MDIIIQIMTCILSSNSQLLHHHSQRPGGGQYLSKVWVGIVSIVHYCCNTYIYIYLSYLVCRITLKFALMFLLAVPTVV